jgi:hypothetical protein
VLLSAKNYVILMTKSRKRCEHCLRSDHRTKNCPFKDTKKSHADEGVIKPSVKVLHHNEIEASWNCLSNDVPEATKWLQARLFGARICRIPVIKMASIKGKSFGPVQPSVIFNPEAVRKVLQ